MRVKITSLDRTTKPYLLGSLQICPDEGPLPRPELISRVSSLFNDYARVIMRLAGKPLNDFSLPTDPTALSYLIASILQTTAVERQRLLETPGSAQRLEAEIAILHKELPMLRVISQVPTPRAEKDSPFSLN